MNEFYFSLLNCEDAVSTSGKYSNLPVEWQKRKVNKFGYVLLLIGLLLSTGISFAQSMANYTFNSVTNASLEDLSNGSVSLLTGNKDDAATTIQAIGFDFYFMGAKYTHFSANSNGQVRLHASAAETVISSTNITSYSSSTVTLAPMAGDNEVNDGMKMKVIGVAPNRKLVVEWTQFYAYYSNITNAGNMQLWLSESSSKVEFVYGEIFNTNTLSITRSIFVSSGNTATASGYVTVGATPTFTVASTPVTNSFAAGTIASQIASPLIANLGSTGNGNRVAYRFTPNTIVLGGVTNLTFTAVTTNGLTVNWNDNSTNESSFLIVRATDAAFTQNVSTTSVPSTTSAGTGTSYNLVQTGLTSGTNYFYKIVSLVEGGASTEIISNVTTLNGAVYYWTGSSGSAWNTFANWNTAANGSGTIPTEWVASDVYVIDGEGTVSGGDLTISVDRASFTIGQLKIINNTNLTLASSATTTRTITISGGPNEDFILETGSALNLNSASNAIAVVFTGLGNTGLIAGAYLASGSTSNLINSTGGTGTLLVVGSTGTVTSNLNTSSACLVGSIPTLRFENGSNYTHANSTTVNYIPTATWMPLATATLNGNTTGTSLTSSSTSLGNVIVNTTLSTATLSAFTSAVRTIQGNLTVNNTGTGKFRAITSGVLTINGDLIINGGTFEVGSSTGGGVIVKGNTAIAAGAIVDLGQSTLQNEGNMENNGSVLSSETTTINSSLNFLGTTIPQTLSGTGSFTGRVTSLGVSNPSGLVISTPVLVQRVNLFTGTIIGSSNITIGTGLELAAAVQIGSTTNTTPGGYFDVAPMFNLGTGVYSLLYLGETTARITGFEVPSSRSVSNLTVNNPNGITLAGGNIEVVNGLTLTNGIVNTTLANHIKHGSATAAGTLTGGSTISFINGPIVRTVANANTGFILFPVGKLQYAPISLAPTTTEVAHLRAETFDSNMGTANPSIINLSANRRWETALVSGAFTDMKVRMMDNALVSTNIPVQAATAVGIYTSAFGSTPIFTAGTPNMIESNVAVTAANFTGFLSFADSNSCIGTPNPGNTIASANSICLGSMVTLSLQNIAVGSGVTYQWKSSTDGATYTDIEGATSATLTVTPLVETFYVADVTCTTGPSTGTSTAVQIVFSNNILTTIPATRCGLGTLTLAATSNVGTTIKWYANASGGTPLASGTSFTTPVIDATTSYFAAAEGSNLGSGTIGLGALTSTSAGISFLSGGWGGVKTQYIIKATELTAAGIYSGPITSLGFEATTSGQTYTGFSVSMASTALNAMTTTFISTGLAQVYLGTLANDGFTPVANAVNTLEFGTGTGSQSSFVWDGTSNIVVSISKSSVPSATNSTASGMKYDATGFTSTAYDQADNLTPADMLASVTADATTGNRPKFIINGQVLCSSVRVPVVATVNAPPVLTLSDATKTICIQTTSSVVTLTSNLVDFDTYVWSPATGVSGDATTGWTFNPMVSTSYTLTAAQTTGSMCVNTVNFQVTVNPIPTAITFSPAVSPVCVDAIQAITAEGGTIDSTGSTIIGTATTLTTENNTDPSAFNNRYKHYWLQMVFTQAELNAAGIQAGNINGVKFEITSIGSASNVTDFRVNLGSTSLSALTGFTSTGLTEVYSAATYNQEIGVNSIVFNLPYAWDGTSNIIVDIRSTGADLANNSKTYYTATSDNKTVTAYTSTTFASSNAFVASNPTANLSLKRLNTTFDWNNSVPTSITWSPATNLYSDAAATIAYVSGASAKTVYFKSSTVAATTYTASATTSSDCSVSTDVVIEAADCAIPYANLQVPGTATVGTCASASYSAQVFKPGVTEAAGQGAGITAWIGKNTTNTDPSTWAESSWQLATFNTQVGNNDECQTTFAPSAAGTYYVASRFVYTPGQYVYGGFSPTGGGIWDGTTSVNAVLTVEATLAPTATDQIFCNGATVADLMASGAALQWYTGATDGTALAATTALATGNYYVSQTLNACESARTMVAVTVTENVTPAFTEIAPICSGETLVTLPTTSTNGITGAWSPAFNNTATTTYTFIPNVGQCALIATMTIVVNTTAAPTGTALQDYTLGQTLADFTVIGQNITWYSDANGSTVLPSTTVLVSGTTYFASQTLDGCESITRLAVTAGTDLKTPTFEISNLRYYPNPVQNILTIEYSDTIENVQMYNMLGQLVYNRNTNASTVTIEMTSMAAGNYILQVTVNGTTKNVKVIKK